MTETKLFCNACHKSEDEVSTLLAFPGNLNICDECLWLMVEIVANQNPEWRDQTIQKLTALSES